MCLLTVANPVPHGRGTTPPMPKNLLSQARILIVDDEPSNIRLLERILQVYEARAVRHVTDPRETLSMVLNFQPDIILLDLNMPHFDGHQVLEQLKDAIPVEERPPVIVLTADITPEAKRRALTGGAKDFLTKPFDQTEVVLRIRNLLETRFFQLELRKQNGVLEILVQERTSQLESTLSELRATQDAVVKQERLSALGMMAGGIAHDFNNALTMMLGYSELLLPWLQAHGSERELGFLRNIVAAAQDSTHIVGRLREFYRPAESNEIREPVALNTIVEQAVALTAPKWKARSQADGIQISVLTELRDVPQISGCPAELREVLTNLIFNAVDAMPYGGAIIIATAEDEEGRANIAVSDTGTGMTEEQKQRCLEPFFTTKGERGTGLGLSVVYGILQRHEAHLEIVSQPGHGTTFNINFPANAAPAITGPKIMETAATPLQILVVDDQELISELIAECLKGDGHTTMTAANGREALELFRKTPADLVLTDQSMPGMNGVQLSVAIKELAPQTPVILLTGFGEEMNAAGSAPGGVDLVVGKPVSGSDLRKAIHQVMAKVAA
jgi:CheY-like chemotaxis protein